MALGAAVFVVLAWRGQGADDQFGATATARSD
jgi:hypothetical protein